MNVCLINPQRVWKLMSATQKPAPPLGLAFIAGALKKAGHKVTVIDSIAEQPEQINVFYKDTVMSGLSFEELVGKIPSNTELIGLGIMFSGNWLCNRALIDFLGDSLPGIPIIAGGEHITAIPEFCITETRHLKACVLGEGEETAVDLVDAIEKNRDLEEVSGIVFRNSDNLPVRNQRRTRTTQIEDIPLPAWELFPLDKYYEHSIIYGVDRDVRSLPLMATRGCPYSCTFCSSPLMWGTRYYLRSPQNVADEIEHFINAFGVTNFDFYDLTAIIKKDWILAFSQEIVKRKLNITWQIPAGTRSEAIDQEVAHFLYLSGCRNITYAPESGSPEILRKIKKKVVLKRMLQSISYSHKEKMNIKINFMLGFPDEGHKNIWESLWFLVKASWYGVTDMSPSSFSPYPGSELFIRLVNEGKLTMNDDYFFEIVYADTFFSNSFYNEHINKYLLRGYVILYLLVFYGTNYLFRPNRLFKTIRNLLTSKLESRGEMAIGELLKRKSLRVTNHEPMYKKVWQVPYSIKRTISIE